jgi:hypothetical protein
VTSFHDELMETLARAKRRDRTELERELLAAGPECPFDSIYLVRIAVRTARRNGIDLKPTREIAKAFKSVDGVATLLTRLANEQAAA